MKWYFVFKIVLTYCEEKLFNIWNSRLKAKSFEITRTIYLSRDRSEQFSEQDAFLTYSWRFLRSTMYFGTIIIQIRNLQEKLQTTYNVLYRTLNQKPYLWTWMQVIEIESLNKGLSCISRGMTNQVLFLHVFEYSDGISLVIFHTFFSKEKKKKC